MNTAIGMLLEITETSSDNAIDRLNKLPDAAAQLADGDYWGSVGIMALTGILVVFLILAILIFFFWLMGTIFKAIDKSKAEKKASAEAAKTETDPAPAAETVQPAEEDDEEELIAVISAAIAAYEGDGGFTIRSIKRRGGEKRQQSAWRTAGVMNSIDS